MSFDLAIDTQALRQGVDRLTAAAQRYRCHHPDRLPPLSDGALGATAEAREVQDLAHRRSMQAFELADELASAAQDLADRVSLVAQLFDQADSADLGNPASSPGLPGLPGLPGGDGPSGPSGPGLGGR